jgi:hypothetical protein
MEAWRSVWRNGFLPQFSDAALAALQDGLERDDARILQGATTSPPPLICVQDWACEAACPVGFACWQGDSLHTVGEVEEAFAIACFEADKRLGETSGCRWGLNWLDDAPRDEMRRELGAEASAEIARREATQVGVAS